MQTVESYSIASVDRREVLRYLGYTGQPITPELDARIDGVVARAIATARPRGVVRVFDVAEGQGPNVEAAGCKTAPVCHSEERGDEESRASASEKGSQLQPIRRASDRSHPVPDQLSPAPIRLVGSTLELSGQSIARHLEGAVAVGVLAVTVGMPFEQELRRLSLTNPTDQAIFDSCGSALVERAADAAEASLMAEAQRRGLYTNSRFSPGYGDLPLATQPALLATVDAQRRLGITLSSTLLMTPCKSVTAVVGFFEEPQATGHVSCKGCLCFDFCTIRPTGRTCRD